ncbi:MAG: hypothetical protein J7M19_05475 [Planctomycetes bacterium]|nr:hypothetical protein [Planctomycetota bacterium]
MHTNLVSIAAAVTLATCITCICGCPNPVHVERKAQVRVAGTLLVVPFQSGKDYYYDSEAGNAVARNAVKALALNSRNITSVDSLKARGPLRSLILEKTIDTAAWAEIGREAGADYILYGSVDELSWRDLDDPSLPRCNFTISFTVVDTSESREIFHTTRTGRYPIMLLADGGVSVYEMGDEGLRFRAYAYIGKVVARTFYDHMVTRFEVLSLQEGANTTPAE